MSETERSAVTELGEVPSTETVEADAVEMSKASSNEEQSSQASPVENIPSSKASEKSQNESDPENTKSTLDQTETSPISTITDNLKSFPKLNGLSTGDSSEVNDKDEELPTISKLKEEVEIRTRERDDYKKKLDETQGKLIALQNSFDNLTKGSNDEVQQRSALEELKKKLAQTALQLEDRGRIVASQENQINALNNQVTSLKEVVAITRDLLQIRNMEVKHLQAEVDDMETKITQERERHNTMMNKMDAAVRLNADLKKEYETQLCLFQDLREKYEEKVTLLTEEKRALESTISEAK